MQTKSFKIMVDAGLDARTATTLVNLCMQYTSEITIEVLRKKIDFKSIMGVMALELTTGSEITISAFGPDEAEAMDAILQKIMALKVGKEI